VFAHFFGSECWNFRGFQSFSRHPWYQSSYLQVAWKYTRVYFSLLVRIPDIPLQHSSPQIFPTYSGETMLEPVQSTVGLEQWTYSFRGSSPSGLLFWSVSDQHKIHLPKALHGLAAFLRTHDQRYIKVHHTLLYKTWKSGS